VGASGWLVAQCGGMHCPQFHDEVCQ
jgi:hypothetical protein